MSIEDKTITINLVLRSIDDQVEKATKDYYIAKGREDQDKAGRFAEVKWCLAELKMDIIDKAIDIAFEREDK